MGTRYGSAAAVATVLLLGGCGVAGAAARPESAPVSPPSPTPTPTLCAEFPPQPPLPGDVEGWWSSTPADADGNVLTDPADWPAQLREHPRTALVDAATGRVVSSWDRRTCGQIPDFRPPSGLSGNQLVVLDADSGAVLESMPVQR
ncbi:hypothetical protein CELD12_30620 [Cellulomonas sp. NTE-D12]|nr:hypothetical protein CELD12_30620 [Cellulomonas sp. NTE-D12]